MPSCSAASGAPAPSPPAAPATATEDKHLARFFQGAEGAFVLLDSQAHRTIRHNPERASRRFLPASTFKIPHTLIALETGVADGADFPLAWDSAAVPRQPWWPQAWAADQTLRSALANSTVWYYQELARRIGPAWMQAYVTGFGYGNTDISGDIDRFWLSGGLRISADEQVEFLRRFYFGELGLAERTTRIMKDLLVLEETPSYRLSGKTGWAGFGEPSGVGTGWLVGYLERDGAVHFFATNIEVRTPEDAAARVAITKAVLRELGLLE